VKLARAILVPDTGDGTDDGSDVVGIEVDSAINDYVLGECCPQRCQGCVDDCLDPSRWAPNYLSRKDVLRPEDVGSPMSDYPLVVRGTKLVDSC